MTPVPKEIVQLLNLRSDDTTPSKPLLIITAEQRTGKSTTAEWLSSCISDVGDKYVISDSIHADTFRTFTARVQSDVAGFKRPDNTIDDELHVDDLNDSGVTVLDALTAIEADMSERRQLSNTNLEAYKELPIKLLILDEGLDFKHNLNGLPKKLCDNYQLDKDYWSAFLRQLMSKAGRAKYCVFYITHSLTVTSTGATGLSSLFGVQPLIELYATVPAQYAVRGVNIRNGERLLVFKSGGLSSSNSETFHSVPKPTLTKDKNTESLRLEQVKVGQQSVKASQEQVKIGQSADEIGQAVVKIGQFWEQFRSESVNDRSIPPLNRSQNAQNLYAAVDLVTGKGFYEWFNKRLPELYTLHFLLDDNATRSQVIEAIERWFPTVGKNTDRIRQYLRLRENLSSVEWEYDDPPSDEPSPPDEPTAIKAAPPIDPSLLEIQQRVDKKTTDKLIDKVAAANVDNDVIQPLRQQYEDRLSQVRVEAINEVLANFDNVTRSRMAALGVDKYLNRQKEPLQPSYSELKQRRQDEEEQLKKQAKVQKQRYILETVSLFDREREQREQTEGIFGLVGIIITAFFLMFALTFNQPKTKEVISHDQPNCTQPICNPPQRIGVIGKP